MQRKHGLFFRIPTKAQKLLKTPKSRGSLPTLRIRMDNDESFDKFYVKLKDIVNLAFPLGEQIPELKIVRKIFKSLPEKFHVKITTIEESKELDSIPLI